MSFFKDLFEKRKEKKYGKGHKLGTTPTDYSNQYQASSSSSSASSSNQASISPRNQTEASQRAGQAALQRLQQQQQQHQPKSAVQRLASVEMAKELNELKLKEKELEKAIELKNHYFGDNKVLVEKSPLVKMIYYRSDILGQARYSKDEIEDKIEQALINQLDQEPILVSVTLLFTTHYKNPDKLNKCVEIMTKFVDNIIDKPDELKYRKIRVENPIFKEKVYSCKYADLVLKQAGFKAISLKKANEQQDPDIEELEDCFVFDNYGDIEKLKSLKSALSLAEPILPELDRDLKCFRITSSSKLGEFQLSDEFYNLSIEELRKEQKLRNEALEKAGMLRTKAMRERDEHLELRRYNYCLIRVKFPNSYILESLFKSTEKYQDLYDFIGQCLETDSIPFDLFSHTLKKSSSCFDSTLAELGLAPASLLNFKWVDLDENLTKQFSKYFLKEELIRNSIDFN